MAVSFRGCSLGAEATDAAGAIVAVQRDGSILISSGLAENGQGLKTVFSQIAAEELGVKELIIWRLILRFLRRVGRLLLLEAHCWGAMQ